MRRGELWWINFPRPVGRRPGLILEVQDDGQGPVALVAPSSRQAHGADDELELTPEDGVPEKSVLRLDACREVPIRWMDLYITSLPEHRFRLITRPSLSPSTHPPADAEDPGASPYPFESRTLHGRSFRVRGRDGQEHWIPAEELGKWWENQSEGTDRPGRNGPGAVAPAPQEFSIPPSERNKPRRPSEPSKARQPSPKKHRKRRF